MIEEKLDKTAEYYYELGIKNYEDAQYDIALKDFTNALILTLNNQFTCHSPCNSYFPQIKVRFFSTSKSGEVLLNYYQKFEV